MRLLIKLVGLALLLVGIDFLGQNNVFTSCNSGREGGLASIGFFCIFVLALSSGIILLFFFRSATGILGWVLVGLGIVSLFLRCNVNLMPTSLWHFFLAFASLTAGLKLITTGRIDF